MTDETDAKLVLSSGETRITLRSDSETRERCLRLPEGSAPGTKVDRLLVLRGKGGSAVVRGVRFGDSPTETAVRVCPQLFEKVTGTESTNELEAVISKGRWIASLPEFGWRPWVQIGGALVTFVAVALALVITLVSTDAPPALLVGSLIFGVFAGLITVAETAVRALTIKCD